MNKLIIVILILGLIYLKLSKKKIENFEEVCVFDQVKCEKILNKSIIEKNLDDLRLLYDIMMEQDRTTDNIRIIFENHSEVILNLMQNRYNILEKYHFKTLFKLNEITDDNKDEMLEKLIDIVETEIEDLEDMLEEIESNPNKYQNLIAEPIENVSEISNNENNENENNENEIEEPSFFSFNN